MEIYLLNYWAMCHYIHGSLNMRFEIHMARYKDIDAHNVKNGQSSCNSLWNSPLRKIGISWWYCHWVSVEVRFNESLQNYWLVIACFDFISFINDYNFIQTSIASALIKTLIGLKFIFYCQHPSFLPVSKTRGRRAGHVSSCSRSESTSHSFGTGSHVLTALFPKFHFLGQINVIYNCLMQFTF